MKVQRIRYIGRLAAALAIAAVFTTKLMAHTPSASSCDDPSEIDDGHCHDDGICYAEPPTFRGEAWLCESSGWTGPNEIYDNDAESWSNFLELCNGGENRG